MTAPPSPTGRKSKKTAEPKPRPSRARAPKPENFVALTPELIQKLRPYLTQTVPALYAIIAHDIPHEVAVYWLDQSRTAKRGIYYDLRRTIEKGGALGKIRLIGHLWKIATDESRPNPTLLLRLLAIEDPGRYGTRAALGGGDTLEQAQAQAAANAASNASSGSGGGGPIRYFLPLEVGPGAVVPPRPPGGGDDGEMIEGVEDGPARDVTDEEDPGDGSSTEAASGES